MKRKADIFFFYQWTFEDLGEILFVLWTRKGKSLICFSLIFNAQRITECKSKLKAAMATKRTNELRIFKAGQP